MFLIGCNATLKDYDETKPQARLDEYFNGPIKAWGIVQDRSGKVVQRVDIDMLGKWTGDEGTLSESLKYYDGRNESRVWKLHKRGPHSFVGTAEGIIGEARGESNGYAIRWNYTMTIPVGGTEYDVQFDDWMFAMNDKIMVNRSYLKKFGIRVAEISIFMQKP